MLSVPNLQNNYGTRVGWLPWAKQRFSITAEIERQLLSISAATIDRRLKTKKYQIKKRIYSSTRPGYLLKHQIPVRTDNWDINEPGFLELDLVSHGSSSAEGDFIHSLNCTDIHTQWTETRAIMGRGQAAALKAIEEIKDSLPFPLKGIDPDNDQAFINWHLKKFCVMNFFQPSVKLVKKIRIGSKLKRIYDKPKTPFQRVCECKNINQAKVAELKKLFKLLDPFELSRTIDKKLDRIYELHTTKIKIQRTFEERMYAEILQDLSIHNYSNILK